MGAPVNIRKLDTTTGNNRVTLAVAEGDGSIQDLDEFEGRQISDGSTLELYSEDWMRVLAVYRYVIGENWALITHDVDGLTAPIYVSSTVDEFGGILTITFSKPMADPTGEEDAFTVEDGDSVTVQRVELQEDRTKIDLILGRAAHHDDNVTVAYLKGNIMSADVVALETFTTKIVTNPVAAPEFVNSATNVEGTIISIIFDKNMADPTGKHEQFMATNGAPNAITAITLTEDNSVMNLTLTSPVLFGEVVTISYSEGDIVDGGGNILHSFALEAVTNTVPEPDAPTIFSAETNVGGTKIVLVFNKAMADPTGKHAQFSSNDGAANAITLSELLNPTTIELTVTNAIHSADTVTVSYTAGDVMGADNSTLESFVAQAVTNLVSS
jgi:uncharacterized repeat protein (TIGR02059 family)